jgi:N-sulfoglucosamine sulfohydrolase
MRWTWILLLGAVLLSAQGEKELRAQGAGAQGRRPNILFAIADDWGYGHAGAYGCRWVKTPAFDRVARQGLLFQRAYTPNAKCAPSRAILLTGRNSWQLREAANHWCFFPPEFRTYPEALGENGYFVGATGKGWGPGVARDAHGKPRQMTGRPFNARTAPAATSGIGGNDYVGNFDDFLAAAPKGRPWCFWYGSLEPHRGFEYGSGAAKGGKRPSDIDRLPAFWPDTEVVRNDMLDYAFEVEHFDRHLGRMVAALERRGELGNTIVVVTSDHGMPFPRAKGQAYEASNHVPLTIMWGDGIKKPGRVLEDYVSFADVAPTLVELSGLRWEQAGMQPAAGRSLSGLFRSEQSGRVEPQRDYVLVGKERHDVGRPMDAGYPIRGIVKEGMLYLHNFETSRWPVGNPETGYLNCDGGATKTVILEARRKSGRDRHWDLCFGKRPQEELYDLRRDPDCVRNLSGLPQHRQTSERLRSQAFQELKEQGDPRMSGQGRLFDQYPYADESGRGFYERFMRGEKLKAGWVNETDFEKAPLD